MYPTLRTFIWLFLVFGGGFAVVLSFVLSTPLNALLVATCVIGIWIGWGVFSFWLFGLRRRVTGHMKSAIERVTFVTKDVGESRITDYVRTLEFLRDEQNAQSYGASADLPLAYLKSGNISTEQVDWKTIECEDESLISVPTNSVYFLHQNGTPFVAKITTRRSQSWYEHESGWGTGKGDVFELCADSLETANTIIRWLSGQMSLHSIYRGQMLQIASPQDGTPGQTIHMSAPPSATRDSIILPESILELLERLIGGRQKHREQLLRFGHKSRMGILLHGPPGTGKTLVARYLIGSCPGHTVVIPSDLAVETLRECFRLAKYLQPSILVIEDVDLLAPRRETNSRIDGLQELMNEMDGLSPASDTIVIMSTNRPEILEPALTSRPGRVSQSVEFPLPDQTLREQLLKLFLQDACSGQVLIREWAERTEGASPAFLEEMCKRAILLASDRQTPDEQLDVQFDDLDRAIHELVVLGGEVTSKALGFPAGTSPPS